MSLHVFYLVKKEVVLVVFFRGFRVVSSTGSWCSATTDEGVNRLFTGFNSFDKVQFEGSEKVTCCNSGPVEQST